MTMQRKITMGDKVDLNRLLPKLERAVELRRIKATMISMAAANRDGDARWYVLQTRERSEKAVEERLTKENVRSYLPLVEGGKAVVRHRVVKLADRPAMPGYVLVRIVPSAAAFCGLAKIDGVFGLVGGLLAPRWITDNDVSRFKRILGEYDPSAAHSIRFAKGDWVRFEEGPFIGFDGHIRKLHSAVPVRGMPKIQIAATVEVIVDGTSHTVKSPLAFLEKL